MRFAAENLSLLVGASTESPIRTTGLATRVVPSQRIVSPRKAASVGPFANTRSSNIWNRLTNPESHSHSIVLNSIEKAVRNLRRSCYTNI